MKLKLFNLSIETQDPRPLHISVKSFLFLVDRGELHPVSPNSSREFTEEDYLDFDNLFPPIIGLSLNDIAHGNADVKTLEFNDLSEGMYLCVFEVEDKIIQRKHVNFLAFKISGQEISKLYSDDMYSREPVLKRVEKIAEIFGIDFRDILKNLRTIGLHID
ncbi:MAG: hypothetical protein ACP5IE_07685 [Infirmifilum sp.]